ncbi:MAG: hypothetical protein ABL886_01480 [Rhodoglobus sp.]
MDDIDVLLSSSLKRIAAPGDAAGVADAIRARVDAGDTGTPANSSGFGRRPWWMILALGTVVVVTLGLAVSAAVGLAAPGLSDVAAPATSASPSPAPTPLVASPSVTPSPTPSPPPVVETAAPPPEPPLADTTAPAISGESASPPLVYGQNGTDTTISAIATDDTGVVSVLISWTGSVTGSSTMSPGWTYFFDTPPGTPAGSITFTLQAFDAAGNASTPVQVVVTVGL